MHDAIAPSTWRLTSRSAVPCAANEPSCASSPAAPRGGGPPQASRCTMAACSRRRSHALLPVFGSARASSSWAVPRSVPAPTLGPPPNQADPRRSRTNSESPSSPARRTQELFFFFSHWAGPTGSWGQRFGRMIKSIVYGQTLALKGPKDPQQPKDKDWSIQNAIHAADCETPTRFWRVWGQRRRGAVHSRGRLRELSGPSPPHLQRSMTSSSALSRPLAS